MVKMISLLLLLLISGCANKLLKQPAPREKFQRFYKMRIDKPGTVFHRRCKSIKKKERECKETDIDIIKEWNLFAPSYILIPFKQVFK